MPRFSTLAIWACAVLGPIATAAIAAATFFMASSLDPGQAIAAGLDPWVDALRAAIWCVASVVFSIAGLWLWHSRFGYLGVALIVIDVVLALWLCTRFVGDYF